jgi:hypothetical protein
MSYTKRILCLANSRRPSGRCVAGREVTPTGYGPWVRPVSARDTREISEADRCYEGGKDPEVLDIVDIEMSRAQPDGHQQENHVIDDGHYWAKRGVVSWKELQAAAEDPAGPLWVNGCSTYHGHNDKVPADDLEGLDRSLYLVRPVGLKLTAVAESSYSGPPKWRVRARFDVCGQSYRITVTDPWTEDRMRGNEIAEVEYEDALLCVSLSEVYRDDSAHKLAAAVITPSRCRG